MMLVRGIRKEVPGAGIEPAQLVKPGDFKSPASTISAIRARTPFRLSSYSRRPDVSTRRIFSTKHGSVNGFVMLFQK